MCCIQPHRQHRHRLQTPGSHPHTLDWSRRKATPR
jgi:hypothetical protein